MMLDPDMCQIDIHSKVMGMPFVWNCQLAHQSPGIQLDDLPSSVNLNDSGK